MYVNEYCPQPHAVKKLKYFMESSMVVARKGSWLK